MAWDIEFPGETEYDADFVRGVTALRDAGAGVVIGIKKWDVSDPTNPPIAPAIRDARVLWGGTSLNVDDISAWKADLVVQHAGGQPLSSLALSTLSAARQPKMDPVTALDDRRERVLLEYRALDSAVLQASRAFATVTLSAVRECEADDDYVGLRKGSLVGLYALALPSEQTLKNATRPYHEVFAMDDAALARWCAGRVLVFCDNRPDAEGAFDRHEAADQRLVWGGEGHAVAIDALLRDAVPARYPRFWMYISCIALGAAVGVFAARIRREPRLLRVAAVIGMAALLTAACVGAYRLTGYLLNPLALLLALFFGFLAWWWLDRMHSWRLQLTHSGSSAAP